MRIINELGQVDVRLGHESRFRDFDQPAAVARMSKPVDERSLKIADKYLMLVAKIVKAKTKELYISD